MNESQKQHKKLLGIVGKLFKYDLAEVLGYFNESKYGNKQKLQKRLISLIEAKDPKNLNELRKKIKQVYYKNDKIKKRPKNNPLNSVKKCDTSIDETIDKVLNQTKELLQTNSNINSSQQLNQKYEKQNILSWINRCSQSSQHSQQSIQMNVNVGQPLNPFLSVNDFQQSNEANNRFNDFNNISQRNAFSVLNNSSQTTYNMNPNSNPSFITPLVNNSQQNCGIFTNISQQTFNSYSYNSFTHNSAYNSKPFASNYSLNLASNGLVNSPQTLESLIEQQNLLLPESLSQNIESVNKDRKYCFKVLPKYKQILKIKETQIIGTSLSDIGTVKEFNINDLSAKLPSFKWYLFGNESLYSALKLNYLQIQLRFCFITDIDAEEQKDCCPEHLCIDVNGQKLYSYSENEEMNGPFNISSFCKYGPNVVKFWLDKPNFEWFLPCAYEISIVQFYTPESYLNSLKQNIMQFLDSDFTKNLVKLKREQSLDETAINITVTDINTKTKLICPLSCRRIETPCRTTNCKHIECFDGYSFFKMNDSKYDWVCPICQTSASFDLLRIDGYFAEILRNTESSITEIKFKTDGTYDCITNNAFNDNEIIEIDDTMDDENDCTLWSNEWSNDDDCIILD